MGLNEEFWPDFDPKRAFEELQTKLFIPSDRYMRDNATALFSTAFTPRAPMEFSLGVHLFLKAVVPVDPEATVPRDVRVAETHSTRGGCT